jgi:hypothetical protein
LIVRLALGVLLVVTAVLKMTGGSADALRTALPIVSPRLYASGVMAEFILGVWLLSGLAPAWSWLCGLGIFGLLAALSFQLGVTGQASCGCLGKLPVSPWWAFAVDSTSILLLAFFPPFNISIAAFVSATTPGSRSTMQTPKCRWLLAIVMLLIVPAIVLTPFIMSLQGFVTTPLEIIDDNLRVLDPANRHDPITIAFRLRNNTNQRLPIAVVRSSCDCVTARVDKDVLDPGEVVGASATVHRFDANADRFEEKVRIRSDVGDAVLILRGQLPRSSAVRYRPAKLIFPKQARTAPVTRHLLVAMPRDFGPLLPDNVTIVHAQGFLVSVDQMPHAHADALYRVNVVRMGCAEASTEQAVLRIEIPRQSPIEVPVVFAGE